MRERRSIRIFKPTPVETEKMNLVVETALRAPSSRNINPWEFILVDDRGLLERLSISKQHGSAFLKGAAFAMVVCADETKSDVWVEDCSIAAILIQMTVQSLGLGSCWAQIRNRAHNAGFSAEQYVQELLGLPSHIKVEAIIGIGYPAEKREPLDAGQLEYGKISHNNYQSCWKNA